eukprot:SAG11_NODE_103_length_16571_cov_49.569208_8_plen_131_part_00
MTMRRDWGAIDDVYGHGRSDYGNYILPWYVRDPNSKLSLWWDVVQVIFLVYVTVSTQTSCFHLCIVHVMEAPRTLSDGTRCFESYDAPFEAQVPFVTCCTAPALRPRCRCAPASVSTSSSSPARGSLTKS